MFHASMRTIHLLLLTTLAACTAPSEPSEPSGPGGGGGTPDDMMPPSSITPTELSGTTWTWTTTAGAQQLAFDAAAGYTSDVYLDAHPGESCGTEYFTYRVGVATFVGADVTLTSTSGARTKMNSCTDVTLEEVELEPETSMYGWRLEDADTLVLVDEEGVERSFYRD